MKRKKGKHNTKVTVQTKAKWGSLRTRSKAKIALMSVDRRNLSIQQQTDNVCPFYKDGQRLSLLKRRTDVVPTTKTDKGCPFYRYGQRLSLLQKRTEVVPSNMGGQRLSLVWTMCPFYSETQCNVIFTKYMLARSMMPIQL